MFNKTAVCAAVISALSSMSYAQQFTGGTLGVEHFIADGGDVTLYTGGVEFGITRAYGVGLSFNNIDSNTSATLHGIYHLSGQASVGLYYGQNLSGDNDSTFYGVEGGTLWGPANIGGYIGQIDNGTDTAVAIGINAERPLGNQFEFYTDFDFLSDDGDWISTNETGVQYNLAQGPELYIHYGQASAGSGNTGVTGDYIGVGARINFGARRGTTFDAR